MRNLTKASREQSRNAQFESLKNNGYKHETYKGLDIFTHEHNLLLKAYQGTAAKHFCFYKYQSIERLAANVEDLKRRYDYREKRKAEEKERNKGYQSTHAATAAAIREDLKKHFPKVKFSVRSEIFAGGDSVHISWTDGPTYDTINNITSKYQYGHFNGMQDIYENTNSRDDIPQTKYVHCDREISEPITQCVADELRKVKHYTGAYNDSPEMDAYRILCKTTIPDNFTGASLAIEAGEYVVKFTVPEQLDQTAPAAKQEATEPVKKSTGGKIQIVDYSEKAIAVIGDFSDHYDNLIALGGRYNSRLSCGKGIIFSKKRLEAVKAYLLSTKQQPEPAQQPQQPEPVQPQQPEALNLQSFKIIWHEGHQEPNYTGAIILYDWEAVQGVFYHLWEVNEKGNDAGGYTKVKCEITLTGQEPEVCRIDITNKIGNGDFNPSAEHIVDYLTHF